MLRRHSNSLFLHRSPVSRRVKFFSSPLPHNSNNSSSEFSSSPLSDQHSSSMNHDTSGSSSSFEQQLSSSFGFGDGISSPTSIQPKRGIKAVAAPDGFVKRRLTGVVRFAGFTFALTFGFLSCFVLSWPIFDAYILPAIYKRAVLYSNPTTNLQIAKKSEGSSTTFHPQRVIDHLCAILFSENHNEKVLSAAIPSEEAEAATNTTRLITHNPVSAEKNLPANRSVDSSLSLIDSNNSTNTTVDGGDASNLLGNSEKKGKIIFVNGCAESGKSQLVLEAFQQVETKLQEAKRKKEMLKKKLSESTSGAYKDVLEDDSIDEQKVEEELSRVRKAYTSQPLLYINGRGFIDSNTFLYTFMNNILDKNLPGWGSAFLSLQKILHMSIDFFTMSSNSDNLNFILFCACLNHLKIGLERIAKSRRCDPNYESVRRPLIVIDSFERILDIIEIHGKDASLSRFPLLMVSQLLRTSCDEGLCDVLILSDSRCLHGGSGASLKFTKLERYFTDLSKRATFVTLPPRTRIQGTTSYGIGQSNIDRMVSIMKAYHARPFLIRKIMRELNEKGTCDIPRIVKECYLEPDQISECFVALSKAHLCFPAAGCILGSTEPTHPRKYHYVSRTNFLPKDLDSVDAMEVQYLKPRMGLFNYLLCAMFPHYGANNSVIPKTTPASNQAGGAVSDEGGKLTGDATSSQGMVNNINVSLFPSPPEITNQVTYVDFAFNECETEESMLDKIVSVVGWDQWFIKLCGLEYCEDGELWVSFIDMDDAYALRNADQLRPKPAPTWVRDAISLIFWGIVGNYVTKNYL